MRINFLPMVRCIGVAMAFIFFPLQTTFAAEFTLPAPGNSVIGEVKYTTAKSNDTLVTIGQRYNEGVNAMLGANPGYVANAYLTDGALIQVPSQFILPPGPREGIVINLPEMRMYYFLEGGHKLLTFPIGIGKVDKTVPIKKSSIVRKRVNPTWTPTPSIRAFNKAQGIDLPVTMPAGPDNPLGNYAVYLDIPTYLMHSTIYPESIGTRASFGCIRMNENDIKEFFPIVQVGTTVMIINMPNKVGWDDDTLYLETHEPLVEHRNPNVDETVKTIQAILPKDKVTMVDWQLVAYLDKHQDGVPHEIGFVVN